KSASSAAKSARSNRNVGTSVWRVSEPHGTWTLNSTATYAASDSASHRSTLAYWWYGTRISSTRIVTVSTTASNGAGTATRRWPAAPIDATSAAMLNVFANAMRPTATTRIGRENRFRMSAAMP